jgi:hypothetical protein
VEVVEEEEKKNKNKNKSESNVHGMCSNVVQCME